MKYFWYLHIFQTIWASHMRSVNKFNEYKLFIYIIFLIHELKKLLKNTTYDTPFVFCNEIPLRLWFPLNHSNIVSLNCRNKERPFWRSNRTTIYMDYGISDFLKIVSLWRLLHFNYTSMTWKAILFPQISKFLTHSEIQ